MRTWLWLHDNRHRWVTPCVSFIDARTSLTNVQRIVHQCTKYRRIVPSKVVNNISHVIKKCVDITNWSPDIAEQCSDAKCPEHCVAMRGTLIINVRIMTDELFLVFIWKSVSNVRTLATDVYFSPCTIFQLFYTYCIKWSARFGVILRHLIVEGFFQVLHNAKSSLPFSKNTGLLLQTDGTLKLD